jgi:hypothetical protein
MIVFIIIFFFNLVSQYIKVILHQFWVKKISPWKYNLLSYSCMFQVEICSQQLEICKSVCMFIVLAIIVETD